MYNLNSGCLLRKRQRKFPNDDDDRIHKGREHTVVKFAGEITADPGIRTQDWPVTFRPAARHVRKHRKHRQFIIVIPKNERIVPQKQETKEDDDKSRADGARQSGSALFQMPAMESL